MSEQQETLWWQTGVVYQVYPRSFKDTSGNGVGDLQGIIEKLDYLSAVLGIDAIWLSPFYPSPMADFGYDVSDYTAVDPLFGSLEDFDTLVSEAHRRDIKIIIDFVPNHSSDQHPWFTESRSSRDNPKRDWYCWADARADGSHPNNWLSIFGGIAWEWDEKTGQYYLHSFLKEQPDLNWRNPEVKEAMFNALSFWLDRDIDGFRVDVAHFIMKDPQMRDNPPAQKDVSQMHRSFGPYDEQLHLYDKGHEDVHQVYREMRLLLDSYSTSRPRFSIGEIHIFDIKTWAAYYGENRDELHMPFNFFLLGARWQAGVIGGLVDQIEAVTPPGAWPNYVLGNHDEARLAGRLGKMEARLAAMLLLTLRGTPTIYYGDELGMVDVHVPPEKQQDPWGIRVPGLGRDGCRSPMQWNPGPNAGFSRAEPWLPPGDNYQITNVDAHLENPYSILNLYRRLIAYRKTSPALQIGKYHPVAETPDACFVYLRTHEGQRCLVALNFSGDEQTLSLAEIDGSARVVLSTHLDREETVDLKSYRLRGQEGCIIELS